jgi:hypothetical protein
MKVKNPQQDKKRLHKQAPSGLETMYTVFSHHFSQTFVHFVTYHSHPVKELRIAESITEQL